MTIIAENPYQLHEISILRQLLRVLPLAESELFSIKLHIFLQFDFYANI